MGKKFLDSKILYAVLSILLAVVLWFYVSTVQGWAKEETISNIPVTFIGTDVLQDNGLMLSKARPTVDISFSASMSTWTKLSADTISLTIDVSRITEPGTYSRTYETSYSGGVSSSMVTVLNQDPISITFDVIRYASVEVPVRGVLEEGSSIADGYVYQGFSAEPATITVSGDAELVSQVDRALVTYSGENLSETVRGAMSYQLIGVDDQVLEGLDVVTSPSSVECTFEVLKEVEVPLRVKLEAGGGADESNTTAVISPETVTIVGRAEDLESLKELTVKVNLAEIEGVGTQTAAYDIPLAEGLEIQGGIGQATVTVTFNGLTTRSLEIYPRQQFTIISGTIPEGYDAEIRTRSMAVILRGTESALELASADNIRGTIDLSDINLASGQYTVPVNIQFDGTGGAGVQGTNYEVVVRLTKK